MTKPIQRPAEGRDRDSESRTNPTDTQTAFRWAARDQALDDTTQLYALFSAMVNAAGGVDWLVATLDREPSYQSKVSEAMHRREGRYVQLDWLAPLLGDERACELLMGWLSERLGYEPPVRQRPVTIEEQGKALLEVIRELPEEMREPLMARAAKRLGVKPDRFKKI